MRIGSVKGVSHAGMVGLIGLAVGLALTWGLRMPADWGVICLVICSAGPMLWRSHVGTSTCLPVMQQRSVVRQQRLIGLGVVLINWAATLTLFRTFAASEVAGFWSVMFIVWPVLLLAGVIYLFAGYGATPGAVQRLGGMVLERQAGGPAWWALWRAQLLKAFFLPLMASFTYGWLIHAERNYVEWGQSPLSWFLLPLALTYLVDVVFALIGYLICSERFGSQIRSTDSTWSGWAVALACYPPFFGWLSLIGLTYYRDGHEWHHWLGSNGPAAYIWGGSILALTAVYSWATVVFGLRFSNLTNRGIITDGPFRYTKHPAYISKNLSWWLVSVPFVSTQGFWTAVQHCAALLFVNLIYYLRAKTEERHLMADPAYRQYVDWMAQHGLWARMQRKLTPQYRKT